MHITSPEFTNEADALRQAATLWGIEVEYYDIWGKHHVVEREVILPILRTLGVACGSLGELQASIEQRLVDEWSRLAPETVVVFEDEVRIPLSLPVESEAAYEADVCWEFGATDRLSGALNSLEIEATAELRGVRYERRRLSVAQAPLGYHRIEVRAGNSASAVQLIVCPRRTYSPPEERKSAGLAVSLYSLRSERNWGCGDFTDLMALVEWAAASGLGFVGLNPLHAIPNRQPYNTSPYLPATILYRNILYLDVAAVADWKGGEPAEAASLRSTGDVEYEKVYRLKRAALQKAFDRFMDRGPDAEFENYVRAEGASLRRFAIYCALDERIHEEHPDIWLWTDWPAAYQNAGSIEVERFASEHSRIVRFYQYAQWNVDLQLRRVQERTRELGMPIGLYHDMALATDRTGADVWAQPEFYMRGCRVGSPPDDFSPEGQDWAFPPPNSLEHFRNGYKLFAEGIRKSGSHGGALRMDHVMRLFRLFWIPDGCKATTGAYVRDRSADLLKILALESVRARMLIVGEDLGTVSDATRAALREYGILSYRLFFFEKHLDGRYRSSSEYLAQALASTTTHDLPTLAGFWSGHDLRVRRGLGFIRNDDEYRDQAARRQHEKRMMADALGVPQAAAESRVLPDEVLDAVIGFLASTPCLLFCLTQEDLTKTEDQMNMPGTTSEHSNWRRKMKWTVEELRTDPDALRVTGMVRNWLERTGR